MKTQFLRGLFVVSAFASLAFPQALFAKPNAQIPNGFEKAGDFKPSYYWIALEQTSTSPKTKTLLGKDNEVLAQVTERFYYDILMEGTGRLLDGRMLNFWQFVNLPGGGREPRFRECAYDAPYGYGYEERRLVPFRSIAVDPRLIPLDSDIFIPAAVGARLPDGSIHNGHFTAVDIGGAIQDFRIDVFTAFGDQSQVFIRNGFQNMRATPVYVKKLTRK